MNPTSKPRLQPTIVHAAKAQFAHADIKACLYCTLLQTYTSLLSRWLGLHSSTILQYCSPKTMSELWYKRFAREDLTSLQVPDFMTTVYQLFMRLLRQFQGLFFCLSPSSHEKRDIVGVSQDTFARIWAGRCRGRNSSSLEFCAFLGWLDYLNVRRGWRAGCQFGEICRWRFWFFGLQKMSKIKSTHSTRLTTRLWTLALLPMMMAGGEEGTTIVQYFQ